MKYDFIKARLTELGKTQTEFAQAIGITQSKLNVTLNHPELREFQTTEILKAAEFLGYDPESFMKCVSGETTEQPSVVNKTISMDKILMIADVVKEYFDKHGYDLTPEQRAALVDHFYRENIINEDEINKLLSLMQSLKLNGK